MRTYSFAGLEEPAQQAAINRYQLDGEIDAWVAAHNDGDLTPERIFDALGWRFNSQGFRVRRCLRCGDPLDPNDDLICGYHNLES